MGTDAPSIDGQDGATASAATQDGRALDPAGPPPASLADATSALAAIADYYSRREPSSPTLPLVRQARDLVGKSFLEVMTILVPSQVEKAAFQIGTDQVFDLPVGRLSGHSAVASAGNDSQDMQSGETPGPRYRVESRAQAIALLDGVQRYFRVSEPSSPVPMLCERARTMAERDFMSVLRDVLPKAALRNVNIDK
jgi:type VI secretion system protein ImpA